MAGFVEPGVSAPGTLRVRAVADRGDLHLQVECEVAPGEVLGVLGPNGAGKTTLLRVLAGLTPLTSGSVRLGDLVFDDVAAGTFLPPRDRPVGVVFQDYRLFPHLTVVDNVAFPARARGRARRAARAAAMTWLDRLDLLAVAHSRPPELSGGQAQRVALARALAADPGVLLLDEPLAAMDARTRFTVRTQLRRHIGDLGGPVVLVTHDPVEAMVLADRLLVVEDGRVVQQGAPADIASRPATSYVARLIGLNLYPGRLDPRTSVVALDGGGTLVVTGPEDEPPESAAVPPGGEHTAYHVLVTVRPSAVTVHTARPEHASTRNVWPGTVVGFEPLGDRVRLQVHGTPSVLVDVTPGAVAALRLAPGDPVWLAVKATETHAYPAHSE
jgi:molybdate transport system ATP-binding protein